MTFLQPRVTIILPFEIYTKSHTFFFIFKNLPQQKNVKFVIIVNKKIEIIVNRKMVQFNTMAYKLLLNHITCNIYPFVLGV